MVLQHRAAEVEPVGKAAAKCGNDTVPWNAVHMDMGTFQ